MCLLVRDVDGFEKGLIGQPPPFCAWHRGLTIRCIRCATGMTLVDMMCGAVGSRGARKFENTSNRAIRGTAHTAHTIQRRRTVGEARWQRGWVSEAAAPRRKLRSRSLRSTWELPGCACSHGNDLRQAGWMPSRISAVMRDWKIWPVTDTRSYALRRRGRTGLCPQICGVVCMGGRCAAR